MLMKSRTIHTDHVQTNTSDEHQAMRSPKYDRSTPMLQVDARSPLRTLGSTTRETVNRPLTEMPRTGAPMQPREPPANELPIGVPNWPPASLHNGLPGKERGGSHCVSPVSRLK